jgi:two-component system sensor histidine kinase ChiS
MIRKASLARDFTIFSAVIMIAVLITSLCVGLLVHRSYYNKQESEITDKANSLDRELSESFGIVTHYARFLGNKITQNNDLDQNYIKQVFSTEGYYDPNNENIWTKFGWVNINKKLFIINNSKLEERDLSVRSFLEKTPLHPNKIEFSAPALGIMSDQWVLPAGIGVTNKKKEFLGTINTGFHLERLAKKLELLFDRKNLVFMLFNDEMKFVLGSDNIGLSYLGNLPPENLVEQIREQITFAQSNKGFFKENINYYQFSFSYFKHSQQYPFYFIIGENIKVANEEYWQITFPRIAELTIMGLLFIVLLYYFRQHIVKPMILLADSAKNIATGELNSKIHYGQYQEVNLLADQLTEIQKTKQELVQAKNRVDIVNRSLEHKVKERTTELEKALAIKTEFLNSISHEVRTPVQGITSISQGLIEKWNTHTEEKKLALASAVASNSQRLYSLVSNLLDFSIFNDEKIYLNMQEADLIDLINGIIEECRCLYLSDKNIKITFQEHPDKAMLLMDSERIIQVLRNLITNSIKFMNKGELQISVNKGNSLEYVITVKDQGIGIPEKELDIIFSPFVQSSSTKNKVSGAGLGLSICKKIVTEHNGKIWAENNEDGGVSMKFSLPIKHIEAQLSEKKVSRVRTGKILMIDDEPTCQMSMDILLSNTGFTLVSAYGGKMGLEYLAKHHKEIDLVLLDLMMPDMYGLNVLSEIKANPEMRDIPVIIQSGTNDSKEIEKSIALGAKAYVRKPYQRPQILDAIANILT